MFAEVFLADNFIYHYFVENIYKMATKKATDVRDEILAYLEKIKRPLAWITGDNTGIPYSAIYSIFTQRTYGLSEENLKKINKFLNTDFKLSKQTTGTNA